MRHILICDDHPMMIEALSAAIAQQWPAARIDHARDYATARIAAARQPDLILTDLMMPGAPAGEGIRALRNVAPNARMLVITGIRDRPMLKAIIDAGVAGIVLKTAPNDVLLAAITIVAEGGRYLPAELIDDQQPATEPEPPSSRLVEIAAAIAHGLSNKEIAIRLGLSPATIKSYVEQLLQLTATRNRTEAAMCARQRGWI